jgi:hypothetical protein
MSLKTFRVRACKLGIEHQDAGWREAEPGANPGVSGSQPEFAV